LNIVDTNESALLSAESSGKLGLLTVNTVKVLMKWLRYQRVISLETQVGVTSQINKWANTDPQTGQRWDQVPRRSKHPLLTSHTRREPNFTSSVNVSQKSRTEPISRSQILDTYKDVLKGLESYPDEYKIEIDPSVKTVQHQHRRICQAMK
jgi:hypothetical protein